jgi:hypothetical protein
VSRISQEKVEMEMVAIKATKAAIVMAQVLPATETAVQGHQARREAQ